MIKGCSGIKLKLSNSSGTDTTDSQFITCRKPELFPVCTHEHSTTGIFTDKQVKRRMTGTSAELSYWRTLCSLKVSLLLRRVENPWHLTEAESRQFSICLLKTHWICLKTWPSRRQNSNLQHFPIRYCSLMEASIAEELFYFGFATLM